MIKVKHIAAIIIFLLPVICVAQNFGGNAPAKWKQLNTAKARIIFQRGLDSQANRMANVVELLNATTSNTIGGPQRKWNIVLQNKTTISNAYVRMAPRLSELYMTPPQDNFSTGSLRWDENLIIHENRHIQQFSNFNKGLTKVASIFLGQEGQLLANGLVVPNYFFEGDAVWQETLVSKQGRGRMPSFFNGFKALLQEQKNYSWAKIRSGSLKDYVPDHYPLGYILVAYGYQKYGEGFWQKVTDDAVRVKKLFNKAIEKHSGVSFTQFRKDAMEYFQDESFLSGKENTMTISRGYITGVEKNNVIDYLFPNFINEDSILVTKRSYKEIPAFYILINGKEENIKVKDFAIDDYYAYKNGKLVYAAYQSDPRWSNSDFSVIQLLDITTKKQKQLGFRSKYFSPDINDDGSEVLAVQVKINGTNNLVRLSTATGNIIAAIPNLNNYFFTQTKFTGSNTAVSAVRNPEGKMALIKIDLTTGKTANITPFSYNVLGYPSVKGDTVYFTMMNKNADNIYAVTLSGNKIFRLTNNLTGLYAPALNTNGDMVYHAFTAEGNRLAKTKLNQTEWETVTEADLLNTPDRYAASALSKTGAGILYTVPETKNTVTTYKKGLHLFNFHSWRPVFKDPEYGYQIFSDNVLSNFSNILTYTYNRNEQSHTVGIDAAYAALFPVLTVGAEESFNRKVDTAFGKSIQFNTATLKTGFSIPLSFIGGRTNKFINVGAGYNIEQYAYKGVTKNIFNNKAINYINAFFSFSNIGQVARQHINPRWAQTISVNYRDAFNFRDSHKFVGHASLYLPGLFVNHSLVLNGAFQKRDSLPDLFSNNFSYARGYEALSTRQMYKLGVNYHFPLVYPDWGVAGLIYFQRIRANSFYDHNIATARLNGVLTDIKSRSVGGELYFDTKLGAAFPLTIGVRFAHLLDTDLLNPTVKNKWEIILPVNLIPN